MMERKPDKSISRRDLLGAGGAAALGIFTTFREAHGMNNKDIRFLHDSQFDDFVEYPHVHEGKGTIDVKFFRFEGGADPALLLTYSIPPGASEGVHTHRLGDEEVGSFDEFYYIVEGEGQMEIYGEIVPVKAGDNVFTPNGVPHGIENTSTATLVVYLIAMRR